MFLAIYNYEIAYWLKRPATCIYAFVAIVAGIIVMAANAIGFDYSTFQTFRIANAPYALYQQSVLFFKLLLFIIPAVIGGAFYRDFESKVFHILYSFPINKSVYLCSKFLSAFTIVLSVTALFMLGCWLGTQLPNAKPYLLHSFQLSSYTNLFFIYLIPNVLFFSLVSFAVVLFTRNIYTCFIVTVVIIILREILLRATTGYNAITVYGLFDPLCETTVHAFTSSWTIEEQNFKSPVLNKFVGYNRLLWVSIAVLILIFTFCCFSFNQYKIIAGFKKAKQCDNAHAAPVISARVYLSDFDVAHTLIQKLKQLWFITHTEYMSIVRTGAFASILLAGTLFIYVLLSQMNAPYGNKVLPATWVMLAFPVLFFSLLINFITFLYAGILVKRGVTYGMFYLVDVTYVSNRMLLLSKILALVKLQVTMLSVVCIVGVAVQLSSHFYNIEWWHYFFDLIGIHLIEYVIWACLAIFIQTIFGNIWIGLLILILLFFGGDVVQKLGIENFIFRFNQNPDLGFYLKYLELSGYSHSIAAYFIFKVYWCIASFLILLLSLMLWQRGMAISYRNRLLLAIHRFKYQFLKPFIIGLLLLVCTGAYIFNARHNAVTTLSEAQKEALLIDTDTMMQRFEFAQQPRIVAVDVAMHIYPEQNMFRSTGTYTLINKTQVPIDTVIITKALDVETQCQLNAPALKLIAHNTVVNVFKLKKQMLPDDTLKLSFEINCMRNNVWYENAFVKSNGTYITSLIYPALGYRPHNYAKQPDDTTALKNHYRSFDSDYIDFKATVSTAENQTAIAPGCLIKQWKSNQRNYFQYQSTTQVTNDFAFVSGIYKVDTAKYNNIKLAVYYQPTHFSNVAHMINGVKACLAYCEKNYSKYQHKQLNVVEYARSVGDYAQSFAGFIPYSELGFMLDIDSTGVRGLNLPFIGAAHEMAHQWWGMQVIPADVNGSKLVTESMAEYVALKVLQHAYGNEKALLYLEKAHNTYLQKCINDDTNELPLIINTGNNKAHIPYQKGMLALNTMCYYLGEKNLNKALKNYINMVHKQQAPYTTSIQLINGIKQATPDSLKYLIKDLFEDVILYDNKILKSNVVKLKNGDYEVEVEMQFNKLRKSENGFKPLPMQDAFFELGIYDEKSNALPTLIKTIKIAKQHSRQKFVVKFKPSKIVIDPLLLMLDKNRMDNAKQI